MIYNDEENIIKHNAKVSEWSKPSTSFGKLMLGKDEVILIIVIILVGLASFGLGQLSVKTGKNEPISIIERENLTASVSNSANISNSSTALAEGAVVGSKNGKVYHLPWCPGALKIKSENLITFASREEAEKAGYTKAANCKGL